MLRVRPVRQRESLTKLLKRAVQRKERVIVRRRGKELAAVIPIEDLRLLERLIQQEEDLRDIEDARAALAEARKKGTKPLSVFKKELGL